MARQKDDIDYYRAVMNDVLQLITATKYPWPKEFTIESKISFLDNMIQYFESISDYDTCNTLQQLKLKMSNGKGRKKKTI